MGYRVRWYVVAGWVGVCVLVMVHVCMCVCLVPSSLVHQYSGLLHDNSIYWFNHR